MYCTVLYCTVLYMTGCATRGGSTIERRVYVITSEHEVVTFTASTRRVRE